MAEYGYDEDVDYGTTTQSRTPIEEVVRDLNDVTGRILMGLDALTKRLDPVTASHPTKGDVGTALKEVSERSRVHREIKSEVRRLEGANDKIHELLSSLDI